MDCHVTTVSKSAFCSIRNIGRIRKHLTRDAAETVIHAFVTSKIDSSNALLYGITNTQLSRLQGLQNIAARIITYTKRTDHITPVLADLHWLPIEQRLKYKICLMVFKIMHDKAPSYLTELVQPYVPGHSRLRSSKQGLLLYKRNTLNINRDKEVFRSQHQNYGITFQNLWYFQTLCLLVRKTWRFICTWKHLLELEL